MRKLSKKISMLMVLAMLVSLFSGVVSASAASSWSFYNKTTGEIVEVKETIEMESNQFADFDLYKDGKAFDTDVYTVKYESSDADVVWVDAKNGKLRADKFETAEAGDKAVISAKIENKNTGAKTTKSFTITIAEEEVVVEPEEETYTLTATVGGAALGAETLVADKDYALAATVVNGDGEAVEATIAYTIDGVAVTKLNLKAGEYTVVVTATLDGEVIATEKYTVVAEAEAPEVVASKQNSLTEVEITLNNADWAKKFAENIKLSYFAGDVEISDLVKATEVTDATVKVTLYNAMAADVTYKFAFDGYDCAATVTGTKLVPASIKVVSKKIAAGEEGSLEIKAYTANGVDITSAINLDALTFTSTDDSIAVVAGRNIYFFEAGKAAVVNAEYDMAYDEEGNELTDLKASGLYYSEAAYTDTNLNGYVLSNNATVNPADETWVNSLTLSLSDADKYLHAKFTRKYAASLNRQDAQIAVSSNALDSTEGYKYYSTNESVLMVDETTGVLTACSVGSANIYFKDANGAVKGTVNVNVKAERGLNSFVASINDRTLSAGTPDVADAVALNEAAEITIATKDQLGDLFNVDTNDGFDAADPTTWANWKFEIVNVADADFADFFTVTMNRENGIAAKFTLTPVLANILNEESIAHIEAGKTRVVTFKITAKNGNTEKFWSSSVTIKNVTGVKASSITLDVDKTTVDMKLDKKAVGDYNVTAKLSIKDSAGYNLGVMGYTPITAEADAVTDNGVFSIIVKKGNDVINLASDARVTGAGEDVVFAPVYTDGTDDEDAIVKAIDPTSYTIKVFKGNGTKAQAYASKTVSFTNSTAAVTAVVNNTNVDVTDAAALKAAIDFYRGANKIDASKIKSVVAKTVTDTVNNKVFLKDVTVTFYNSELNSEFAGVHTEVVAVNKLFTIPQ